jgi:hypothetical protein
MRLLLEVLYVKKFIFQMVNDIPTHDPYFVQRLDASSKIG